MQSKPSLNDQARIVPGLRKIQAKYGYLNREAMVGFHRDSGIPLQQLQAVASFFPHFQLNEPNKDTAVTVHVCRDMACHLSGSDEVIAQLEKIPGACVKGVSCLGRCDRAVATCVTIHQSGAERFYHGRSISVLDKIVRNCVAGSAPSADDDEAQPYSAADWKIDAYRGPSDYAAARRAATLRKESIDRAVNLLIQDKQWPVARAEQFRTLATAGDCAAISESPEVHERVCDWQCDRDWAVGLQLGGWADALLAEMDDAHADLRGMGGAGIPATQKWRDVREAVRTARIRRQDDRAFIVVNGDESEPGTFKDRELLLRTPHLIVEAVILAGLITEATEGFIYIRHEYHEQIEACRQEIARAERAELCGAQASILGRPFPLSVFVSPGGYICGEQSALIEAMSGRRGEPRNLPPKLETNGLYNQPTLVSNVETFAWVPFIVVQGGAAYAKMGVNDCRGRRFFSVSGDVNRPGVYEVPMGLTLRELLNDKQYCGGIIDGKKLKALAPSGPSGGFLPATLTAKAGLPKNHTQNKAWLALAQRRGFDPAATELDILDLELELNVFRALSPTQALGAGLVVYAEGRDMAEQAVNSIQFYANETCGKCVPCRVGSKRLVALGENLLNRRIDGSRWKDEILPVVKTLGKVMESSSICGLGRSIPVPLRTVMEFFPQDLAPYLQASAQTAAPAKEVAI